MSQKSKEEYVKIMGIRYRKRRSKGARSLLLDEFCEVTGHDRKYAIKVLGGARSPKGSPERRGRPRRYGGLEREVIRKIWETAEMPCGKRLQGLLPEWIGHYETTFGAVDPGVKARVCEASPATLDRLLADYKVSGGRRMLPPKNAAVKAEVEVRAESWDVAEAGWIEADTVALCGGSMGGDFVWALTCTDIYSGWTEVRGIWNTGARTTCEGLQEVEKTLPFALKGIDTDNGSEFLNWHVVKHYRDREVAVKQTRSRPYRKNDQAHVEQKNYTHVRQLMGYDRYGHAELVEPINGLLSYWSLWKNLYHPTMRQVSCHREGSRRIRRHEKRAHTPYQRLRESGQLTTEQERRLEELKRSENPFEMKRIIEKWLSWIMKETAHLDGAEEPTRNRPRASCPWLRYAPPAPRGAGSVPAKKRPTASRKRRHVTVS